MKIYISGPISGMPIEEARAKFQKSKQQILAVYPDAEIINPLEITQYEPDKRWCDYMIPCLDALKDCDMIILQSTWKRSAGARIEHDFARACDHIEINYLAHGRIVRSSGHITV